MNGLSYWDDPKHAAWVRDLLQRARPSWTVWRSGGLWWAKHQRNGRECFSANAMILDRYMAIFEGQESR